MFQQKHQIRIVAQQGVLGRWRRVGILIGVLIRILIAIAILVHIRIRRTIAIGIRVGVGGSIRIHSRVYIATGIRRDVLIARARAASGTGSATNGSIFIFINHLIGAD